MDSLKVSGSWSGVLNFNWIGLSQGCCVLFYSYFLIIFIESECKMLLYIHPSVSKPITIVGWLRDHRLRFDAAKLQTAWPFFSF